MGKRKKHGSSNDGQVIRARIPRKQNGDILGRVTQILGNSRMRVRCADGVERLARIRGKLQKRMWTRLGDIVIVQPWEFQPERCDIVHRYRRREAAWLERKGFFNEYLEF